MFETVKKFSSLKITLVGLVLLVGGSVLSYGNPDNTPIWALVVPMGMLAINLLAAIATNARINQQPGLLVFHISLLLILLLATIGRLTHMDAHLEIVVGTEFEVDKLMDVKAGPLHSGNLDEVKFVQGPFTVAYSPGVRRGLTHSNVRILTAKGEWEDNVVGDDRPMVIEGYRFYTTFNKGFSSILTWIPDDGVPVTGTINMPSYPLFEYKQDNRWEPPGSNQEIKFWLQLKTGMDENNHWILDGRTSTGVLIVSTDEQRHEVQVGESVRLRNGMLRFEALTTWMGYRLFYDPTIQWMFFVSVMGVLGLGQYFWKKTNLQPWMDEKPDTIVSGKERPLVELGSQNAGNQYSDGETVSTGMAAGERR